MVAKKREEDGRRKKRPGVEVQREHVLAAAVDLFVVHGSGAVSISQICERAGVSRPTFYRCFPNKEALIDSIYESAVQGPVRAVLAELPGRVVDREWTREVISRVLDAIFARARLAELIYVESRDPASPAAAIVDAAYEEAANVLEAWLLARGAARPSRLVLKALMAASQWIAHDAIRAGLTADARAAAKLATLQLTEVMLGGLQRGGRGSTAASST